MLRAFDHICMKKALYKFVIIVIVIVIFIVVVVVVVVVIVIVIFRSPLLGACNSHNKPVQRHFYRPVYF